MNFFKKYKKTIITLVISTCLAANVFCLVRMYSEYTRINESIMRACKKAAKRGILKRIFFFLPL